MKSTSFCKKSWRRAALHLLLASSSPCLCPHAAAVQHDRTVGERRSLLFADITRVQGVHANVQVGKLDVVLTYLWRVHGVDYYAGAEVNA